MFASARAAAGRSRDDVPGATVAEVLDAASERYGQAFDDVLGTCRIWVNGEPAAPTTIVSASDEIAVLPPVSGGVG
jgi:molybdopterin converting factor small subunit